jgi:hypothetical protein
MWKIIEEIAPIILGIGQKERTLPTPLIILKITLILNPAILHQMQLGKIKPLGKILWFLIIEHAIPINLIIVPLALISQLLINIIQCTTSLHLIMRPFTTIFAAISIDEGTVAMALVLQFVALVCAAGEHLAHVDWCVR